jgi:spore coat protein A, manganese oxidase
LSDKKKEENTFSRRKFIKTGAIAGGAAVIGLAVGLPLLKPEKSAEQSASKQMVPLVNASFQVPGQIPIAGTSIPKYVTPLAHFANTGALQRVTGTSINVNMEEVQQLVLPAAMYPTAYAAGTWVWGYNVGARGAHTPGFTIVATKGTATTVNYLNSLPGGASSNVQKLITVDQTIKWADPLTQGITTVPYTGSPPAVVHLHGGEIPSKYDGGPNAWFTADGAHHGPGYDLTAGDPANGATYVYPNNQEAANIWFHDHVLGATRTNVYSGMAAFYLVRDEFDTGLPNNPLGLPADNYEIEMAIQDRQFDTNGQLLFPDGYPAGLNGPPPNPTIHPYWIPEFLGDVIIVNGNSWPFLDVEPRRYRFRIVNGSNSRFYSLKVAGQGGAGSLPIWQIGTDGGLLDAAVMIAPPNEFLIAPGERADIIIDFTNQVNKTFTFNNSARAPYPKGATANPQTVGQIMQFRVILPFVTNSTFDPAVNPTLRGVAGKPPAIRRLVDPVAGTLAAAVTATVTRQLTLNEVIGPGGPIEVLVNNSKFAAAETENPAIGSTEVWEIINLTADSHPIHLHLVQFQLMNRQAFQTGKYIKAYNAAFPGGVLDGVTYPAGTFMPGYGPPLTYAPVGATVIGGNPDVTPFLQKSPMPPNPNEAGWKDTVIMNPGEVTRIVMQFKSQDGSPFSFNPSSGPGYVWHCHIVDHEDNEMMRPYRPI